MRGTYTRRAALTVLGTAVAGCSGLPRDEEGRREPNRNSTTAGHQAETPGDEPPQTDGEWEPPPADSPVPVEISPTVLVENLEVPWDIAVAPNGELFVTERTGRVIQIDAADVTAVVEPEGAIDAGAVEPGSEGQDWQIRGGEGGTLGLAIHPDYPEEPFVYVYFTSETMLGRRNRVLRYDLSEDDPNRTSEVVIDDVPAAAVHNGGRIDFGPDGDLWVLTGDAREADRAQDPTFLGGKVLRIDPQGNPIESNPDFGSDADPRLFTVGHRNPQGLAWLPDGTPLLAEHGPSGRDEVSVLYPGGNYGWDDARGGPDDRQYASYSDREEYVPPVVNTGTETWAPSGATFYTGEAVRAWKHRLLVGGLRSQRLWIVTLSPDTEAYPLPDDEAARRFDAPWTDDAFVATAHAALQDELGRIRHVEQGPDGELYAITSNRDGRASGDFPTERDDVLVRLDVA